MTFLSLFSGIGGLDLGLERAGMRCIGQVEIDPFCRRVLAKHWPNVPKWDDVRSFDHRCIVLRPDVVAGGFPCKQASTAAAVHGRRQGLAGKDTGLWYDELRIISCFMPDWAIAENVGGIASWASEITEGLEGLGYTVSRLDLSAAGIGAPHLRRRVFFVANFDGKRLEISWPSGSSQIARIQGGATDGNHWLQTLPGLLRVADGVSDRLGRRERIAALGNAVVPQVAEWIGRRIMEAAALSISPPSPRPHAVAGALPDGAANPLPSPAEEQLTKGA